MIGGQPHHMTGDTITHWPPEGGGQREGGGRGVVHGGTVACSPVIGEWTANLNYWGNETQGDGRRRSPCFNETCQVSIKIAFSSHLHQSHIPLVCLKLIGQRQRGDEREKLWDLRLTTPRKD